MSYKRSSSIFSALYVALRSLGVGGFLLSTFCFACSPATTTEPEAVSTPRFVNDLSALSDKPVATIQNPEAAYAATHADVDQTTGHGFEDKPGMQRSVGTESMPAMEQLMNPKAAQFAHFSAGLLDNVWGQLRIRENDDEIVRLKLPKDLEPVILTATLSPEGKLQEIIIEQRSGKTIVDKLFIDACKKGLWVKNPPKAAAQPNGTYQVRFKGRLENFASTKAHSWTFTTYMGIALL